jgi:hypothetical protein
MKKYKQETYERHKFDYCRKNVIYKVAHGHRVKPSTLEKYNLPLDIHPFHPLVLKRREYKGPCPFPIILPHHKYGEIKDFGAGGPLE